MDITQLNNFPCSGNVLLTEVMVHSRNSDPPCDLRNSSQDSGFCSTDSDPDLVDLEWMEGPVNRAYYRLYSPDHDKIEDFPAPALPYIPPAYVPELEQSESRGSSRFWRNVTSVCQRFGSKTLARCREAGSAAANFVSLAGEKIHAEILSLSVREHESYSSHSPTHQDLHHGYKQQAVYSYKMF